jgi:hypothetical protein
VSLSIKQVYQLARNAGLGHEAAITATAIAMGESGLNPSAVGDTTLTDATWGPSIGLWQIRSVKAETGTGKTRDASRLKSPEFNARSMASISGGGRTWGPWSVYTNGTYEKFIGQVRKEVGAGSGGVGSSPVGYDAPNVPYTPGMGVPVGDLIPSIPGPGDVLDGIGDAVGGIGSAVGSGASGVASAVVGLLVKELAPAVLIGAGVVAGFALIVVGAWRGSERSSS